MPVAVNGLEEARAALRNGARELASPPFGGCHAGVGYYAALIEQLRLEFPESDFTFTVCCGNDPAIAHDALRMGLSPVVCAVVPEMFEKLDGIAKKLGATLLKSYPNY